MEGKGGKRVEKNRESTFVLRPNSAAISSSSTALRIRIKLKNCSSRLASSSGVTCSSPSASTSNVFCKVSQRMHVKAQTMHARIKQAAILRAVTTQIGGNGANALAHSLWRYGRWPVTLLFCSPFPKVNTDVSVYPTSLQAHGRIHTYTLLTTPKAWTLGFETYSPYTFGGKQTSNSSGALYKHCLTGLVAAAILPAPLSSESYVVHPSPRARSRVPYLPFFVFLLFFFSLFFS